MEPFLPAQRGGAPQGVLAALDQSERGRGPRRTPPAYDNAYAVLPFGRIAGACEASGYTDWKVLFDGSGLNAFGEVVVGTRLKQDNVLSFVYQQKSSGTTPSPIRIADFARPQ